MSWACSPVYLLQGSYFTCNWLIADLIKNILTVGLLTWLLHSNAFCRSKHGTPTVSILCSAAGVIFLSWMSFQEILEFLNFLYAIGMLLEFAAFIRLRIKKPDLYRPYRVPLHTFGVSMLCLPPAVLLILVMCLASLRTFLVSGAVIVLGFFLYPTLVHAKNQNWARFDTEPPVAPPPANPEGALVVSQPYPGADEASVSLLSDLSSVKIEEAGSEIISGGDLKAE